MVRKPVLAFAIIATLILAAFLLFVARGSAVAIEAATVSRLAFERETDKGYLYLHFGKDNDRFNVVNVELDINGDGNFATYEISGSAVQPEAVVTNVPLAITKDESIGFPIAIPDRGLGQRLPIRGRAIFSDRMLDSTSSDSAQLGKEVLFEVTAYEVNDVADFMTLGVLDGKRRGWGVGTATFSDVVLPVAHAAEDVSTERPPEYHAKQEGLEDNNQQYNECAPTAVGNNMRWLAKKYGFEDKIPADFRELVDEIKADLQWNDGVFDPDFLPGKDQFIARRHLPIETHVIGTKSDPDMHWKIYEEMRKGQAIEIGVSFYRKNADGSVSPTGGHTVAVASVFKAEGKLYIGVHDSATKSNDGKPQSEIYMMTGATITDYGGENEYAVIDYAWAQSPLQSVTDGTYTDPLRDESQHVLRQGEALTPAGGEVSKTISRFGFFNVFLEHPGDHLVGETFPVVASVVHRGRSQDMPYWRDEVRHIYTHGAGYPWSLKGAFKGTERLSPIIADNRPPRIDVSNNRYRVDAQFTCVTPGPATVVYEAALVWPRTGGEPPQELLPRYANQLETSQTLTIESPVFFCKDTPSKKKEEPRAAVQQPCPGIAEDRDTGTKVSVLSFAGKCWPAAQFHVAGPDQCDADHYHANARTVYALDGSSQVDPDGCGFGKTADIPTHDVWLDLDTVAPFVGALLE